jgi:uncharacterized membrane protein
LLKKALYSPTTYLFLIILIFNIFFIAYGLQKHAAFQTAGFDLGIWNQKIWGMLNAQPFVITTQAEVEVSLGDHVDLAVFGLMLPVYALYPSPKTLIIVQTIFISLGVLPIYWLACSKLHSSLAGVGFAIVYLLFPALGGALTFDVHGITLATPLLAFMLWAIYRRNDMLFIVLALLAMGCQEDMPLLTLMMGLYMAVIQRRHKSGAIVTAFSVFWFTMANFVIIPVFSLEDDNIHLYRYQNFGDTTAELIFTILTRPDLILQEIFAGDKKFYWIRLTTPTAFTALLDPLTLLLATPSLLINTLSTYPPTYQLDRFHSSAPIVPFVVVASINGVARLVTFAAPKFRYVKPPFLQNSLLAMILIVTFAYQIQFGHTPIGRYFNWPVVTRHHQKVEALLAQIPAQAAVAAQNNLAPRLSQRQWIFILPKLAQHGQQAEYIAFDMQGDLIPYDFIEDYCHQLAELLTNPNYGLIYADEGLLLFKQGASDMATFEPMAPCL